MKNTEIKNQNTIEKRIEELNSSMDNLFPEVEKRSALWLDIIRNEVPEIVKEFISGPVLTPNEVKKEMLVILAKRADLVEWHSFFYRRSGCCYPEAVNAFATSPDEEVQREVAKSKYATQAILTNLVKKFPNEVLRNPVASLELLNSYMESEYAYAIADNTSASEEMLDRLADHHDCGVRRNVANNTSSSYATLQKLASDTDGAVRRAVASSTFELVLRGLAKDVQDSVRLIIANNKYTPIDVLAYLMENDADSDVRNAAYYTNKNYLLLRDPAYIVQKRINEIIGEYNGYDYEYNNEYRELTESTCTESEKLEIIEKYRTRH